MVKVAAYAKDAPGACIWIQNQGMGASVTLDEEEAGALIKGPRGALDASKEIAASPESRESRESRETSRGG